MAGLAQAEIQMTGPGGPFGRMARRQYAALVVMRWRMVTNNLRSVQGAFEIGASPQPIKLITLHNRYYPT